MNLADCLLPQHPPKPREPSLIHLLDSGVQSDAAVKVKREKAVTNLKEYLRRKQEQVR